MSIRSFISTTFRRSARPDGASEADVERVTYFENVFRNDAPVWGTRETKSGGGSTLMNTVVFREQLSALLRRYAIDSVLDCPCGDFNFMKEMDLTGIDYVGADIVKELIDDNAQRHQRDGIRFVHLDLTQDKLPRVDLVLVKDCLQHLSIDESLQCLRNIQRSGSKYLLINHCTEVYKNVDSLKRKGGFYNLTIEPFNLKPPIDRIEKTLEIGEDGKPVPKPYHYYLWQIEDLGME